MEPLYNIHYAGEVLEGQDPAAVRVRLGKLFKAPEATLDKLFSGQPQLLKRDCDKATALKYKKAMEQAGAKPLISAASNPGQASSSPPEPDPAKPAAQAQSAAERIAALAAAPDVGYRKETPAPVAEPAAVARDDGLSVNPAQGELLRPDERREDVVSDIDVSAFSAQGDYQRLEAEAAPAPPPPDTTHLDMGAAGELIPNLPSELAPLSPDTSALVLSPEGTDFSDCAAPEAMAPQLDLSAIDLAPEGSDVLEEQYRQRETAAPPATDHLSLGE